MHTRDEWRQILGPALSEAELDEFVIGIRSIIDQMLDVYFRDEFDPDDG